MKKIAVLAVAALALTGCQGLSNALGLQPKADAPAYSGIGVVMLHNVDSSADGTARSGKIDQSGAVGASGTASQTAEQTQEMPAEVVEAIITAAQGLIAAGKPEAASALLGTLGKKQKKAETPAPVAPATK